MTPDGLPDISDLERAANEATAAGLDPVTVLAELAEITDHGPGYVTAGDVHLSQGVRGWYATVADPPVQVGRARIRGAW
jgi:hypothetical protein